MLQMTGKVINLYTVDGGTDKEGKEFSERYKVQLLGNVALPNGENKNDLIDLTIPDFTDWTSLQNKDIAIEVGAFPMKGNIVYFVRKGAKPQLRGAMNV